MSNQQHEWTYKQQDSEIEAGPVPEAQLLAMVKNGTIVGSTLVRSATRTKNKWIAVKRIPAVAKLLKLPNDRPTTHSPNVQAPTYTPPINKPPIAKDFAAAGEPVVNPYTASTLDSVADQSPSQQLAAKNIYERFKPLNSTAVTWLIRATMFAMAISGLCALCCLFWGLPNPRDRAVTSAIMGVAIILFILILVSQTFLLLWKYRAYANLKAACVNPMKTGPGWCVGVWFIPFINFFRPANVMNEIQSRSKATVGWSVVGWWVAFILAVIAARVAPTAPSVEGGLALLMLWACLAITAEYLLLKIIRTVTEKQTRYWRFIGGDQRGPGVGDTKPTPRSGNPISIDHWQDDEPVVGNRIDNPIFGALAIALAGLVLFCLPALLGTGGNSNHSGFAGPGSSPPRASIPDDPSIGSGTSFNPEDFQLPPGVMPSGAPNTVDPRPKQTVSELITDLVEPEESARSSFDIKQDLRDQGCGEDELVRRLCTRLGKAKDAGEIERIILVISETSSVMSNDPGAKRDFAVAVSVASRHLQSKQLQSMDQRAKSLILHSADLPQSSELLSKLASTSDLWGRKVLDKLGDIEDELGPVFSVEIARENNINPSHLGHKDSDVVRQFIWEGKLEGKEDFVRVPMDADKVNVKAFADAAKAKLARDPGAAVDSLMSLALHRQSDFDKDSLPEELIGKIDDAMSTNAQKYFVDTGEKFNESTERGNNGSGPAAFLDLANHLGGRKTKLALAELGTRDPSILQKFFAIRDMLLSIDEPETYDAIAIATAFHGVGHSEAMIKNIGKKIEPNFLQRLKVEVDSEPTKNEHVQWIKRVENLLVAIGQIGTEKSRQFLNSLPADNRGNGRLGGIAAMTMINIDQRLMRGKVPTKMTDKTTAGQRGSTNRKGPEKGTIKVSTDGGETFKSSVNNIVQGRIARSSLKEERSFDHRNMWHSGKLESGWATVELEFPTSVTLDQIQIYSRHSGKTHPVEAARVFSVVSGKSKLLSQAKISHQRFGLRFKSTPSKHWKLELKAGRTQKVVVRGLRFFDGKRELYPPLKLP